MIVFYLHGFNSDFDPDSSIVKKLSEKYKVIGISYNSFATMDEIQKSLVSYVKNFFVDVFPIGPFCFAGKSLGAFHADALAWYFQTPSILINPCYDPYSLLVKYLRKEMKNFKNGKTSTLSYTDIESYKGHLLMDKGNRYHPLIGVDLDDEVIDNRKFLYEYSRDQTFDMSLFFVYNGGSHRFDHIDVFFPEIIKYLNRFETSGIKD